MSKRIDEMSVYELTGLYVINTHIVGSTGNPDVPFMTLCAVAMTAEWALEQAAKYGVTRLNPFQAEPCKCALCRAQLPESWKEWLKESQAVTEADSAANPLP